jgi:SAM-dependent methyltransferase
VTEPSLRDARAAAYENPRPEVTRLVPPGARRILDLGCASGAVGASLRAGGAEVVGVERDPGYAEAARAVLDRVIEADLEELAATPELEAELGRFDCLIAADVLEHLVDPWRCVEAFAPLLHPGGLAIASLPNVRYWETLWQLGGRGRWPRRCEGIFDSDHLRWFTARDGLDLLADAGLEPVAVERTYRLRPSRPRWPAVLRPLERTPLAAFFAFQNIIVARQR